MKNLFNKQQTVIRPEQQELYQLNLDDDEYMHGQAIKTKKQCQEQENE